MPRHDETWVCDVCGEPYSNEADAICCEGNHVKPIEVISYHYYYDGTWEGRVYPGNIAIKMSNGKQITYNRRTE